MKEYKAPSMAIIRVDVGTSFAAYNCYERITWVEVGMECNASGGITPMIDAYHTGSGSNGCWHGDVG